MKIRTAFLWYLSSIVLMGILSVVMLLMGYSGPAYFTSSFGLLFMMMAWVAWIAVWDSKSKWPEVGWFTRMARVMTFYR